MEEGLRPGAGKITKRLVDALLPEGKAYIFWDVELKRFGVKVNPGGAKAYVIQYRMGGRETPSRRHTIGNHGAPWTPDLAREEAKRLLRMVDSGQDPKDAPTAAPAADTVERIFAEFLERHHRAKGHRNAAWVSDMFQRNIAPHWGGRALASITRRDCIELLDQVAARAPIQANRTRAILSSFFAWCAGRDIIASSPIVGTAKPAAETARDRVLSDDELVCVWRAAEAMTHPFGTFVQALILTAQRRDEVAGMAWRELDFSQAQWVLPGERTKNGRAHVVHLGPMAVDLLARSPRFAGCDQVFTTSGRGAIRGYSGAKRTLDERVEALRAPAAIEPFERWTFHDLRRTVATGMAGLSVPPHVVEKILNHSGGTIAGVAKIYNRFEYFEERRSAMLAWERKLAGLLGRAG